MRPVPKRPPRPWPAGLTPVGALILLIASLPSGGCLQLHLSDGSGGIYEKGNYLFKSPARIFSRKPKPDVPDPWRKLPGATILVDKAKHRLFVYVDGRLKRDYEVSFGRRAKGHKLHEGDRRTPEGAYRITMKKDLGQTRFHRALLISYPNARDWGRYRKAKSKGRVPAGRGIGGLIEIHGGGTGVDWTDGCVALENDDMDDLFKRVRVGTPIMILGDTAKREKTFPRVKLLSP